MNSIYRGLCVLTLLVNASSCVLAIYVTKHFFQFLAVMFETILTLIVEMSPLSFFYISCATFNESQCCRRKNILLVLCCQVYSGFDVQRKKKFFYFCDVLFCDVSKYSADCYAYKQLDESKV